MYSVNQLKSGLKVLTAPCKGTESVTVMVFAGAGSRYERQSERGISHFLEHMFFKGGKKYKSTREVSASIDSVGGIFNAFTGKEYAGYFVKVAAGQTTLACDVLSDMLINAAFPKADLERERGVIIEEERMYQDTPMYRAGWDFERLLFGDHPLGWDTIGLEKVILSVQQKDFQDHKKRFYTPDNTVVVFSGNIQEKQALSLAGQYFAGLSGTKERRFVDFEQYGKEQVFLRKKQTEQAHLVFGVPAVPALHKDHYAHKLLAIILGGSMSSRMFLNIREARGLCYYIATETDCYLDAGSLSTRAGVDQSRLKEAIEAIKHEYLECAARGITEEELARAKSFFRGKITLSLEDSEERAHFYGKQQLLYPEVKTIEQYFESIEAVSREQVNSLAAKLLQPAEFRLVIIGKEDSEDNMRSLINS